MELVLFTFAVHAEGPFAQSSVAAYHTLWAIGLGGGRLQMWVFEQGRAHGVTLIPAWKIANQESEVTS